MIIYQLLTFVVLGVILIFPYQLDIRISYIILIFGVLLIPLFIKKSPILLKNFKEDFAHKDYTSLFFVGLIISTIISTFFSINFMLSIFSLTLTLSYFIFFHTIKFIFPNYKAKERLVIFFVFLNLILSFISFYNFQASYVNYESNGTSFMWTYFGHNHLSALLLFSIPLSLYLTINFSNKALKIIFSVIFLFFLVMLYLTFARSSIISLLIAVLFSALIFGNFNKKIFILTLIISLFTTIIILANSVLKAKQFNIRKYNQPNLAVKILYWQQAIDNFAKKPFFGSGPDTFRIIRKKSQIKTNLSSIFAHNFFLQTLSDIGIAGFISSVGLIISILWKNFKEIRKNFSLFSSSLFTGIFASSINTFVDFDWQISAVFLILLTFTAFLTNLKKHV